MESSYQLLLRKLNEFIRRYYKNELLKGTILAVGTVGIFFLIFILLEYFGQFGTTIRTIFFWSFIAIVLAVIVRWVGMPLFKLLHIGKTLTYEEAAKIIGNYFEEVSDVLLNTLQLKNNQEATASQALIEASIDQKIKHLKPIPFKLAISYKSAIKYLKYGLPPIAVLLFLFLFNPAVVTKPAERIVKYSENFIPPPPFQFEILNNELKAIQSEDFELEVKVTGEILPDEVFINWNNMSHRMKSIAANCFSYRFTNLQRDIRFHISAGEVAGEIYMLEVATKPQLVSYETVITYPLYTGLKNETRSNNPDIIVPEGSLATWNFYTQDSKWLIINDREEQRLEPQQGNQFVYQSKITGDILLKVTAANQNISSKDTVFISAKAIADAYPMIVVEQRQDSVYDQRLYFRGMIEDDYGFSQLLFVVNRVVGQNEEVLHRDIILINKTLNRQDFFHFANLPDLGVQDGDEISYYFEIFDNDGIHGPKSTKSQILYYKAPTLEEIEQATNQSNENIRSSLDDAMKAVQDIQQEIDKLKKDLLQKKTAEWEDKKRMEEILKKQEETEQLLNQIKQENFDKARKEEQHKQIDEDILNKQRELEKLFDELMNDEMRKMFDEMRKMMDQINKEDMQKALDQMKLSNEEISEQLDRNLELFRQLEFEKDLRESIEALEKLAEEQQNLAEETEKASKDQKEELQEKQEDLNKRMEELSEKLEKMEHRDRELSKPNKFETPREDQKEAEESMKDASDKLNDGKNKKASESQKKASEKMKEMAQKLSAFELNMNTAGLGEDIENLRQILENLLRVSFTQEDLIENVKSVKTADPRYLEVVRNQHQLKDDFRVVEDSLKALAKRQMMIGSMVYGELKEINYQFGETFKYLEDRRVYDAGTNQQKLMTSVNNLTLMLDESLRNMQQQQSACENGNCSSPGNKPGQKPGEGNAKTMRQLQEQLNRQLEDLQKRLQEGEKQGGQNPMLSPGGMSEQLVRSAAQQQAIREMMEEYMKELQGEGYQIGNDLRNAAKEMEQTEIDIINKKITQQTLQRQKDIVTRLLRSEKAELEREEDKRRESTEAKDQKYSNPEDFFFNKKNQQGIRESVKMAPAEFKPYYHKKTNDYLYSVD
ncbi:MAG: hypothetical protein LBH92_04300 [Bacteroidales bacterium]|jgi:hypothetical protein|nr:hypothetical protein [Bacteroidales bacterium]